MNSHTPNKVATRSLKTSKSMKRKHRITRMLRMRAASRTRMLLKEVRKQVGQEGDSSSEDEGISNASKLVLTAAGTSTLHNPDLKDLDLHQPIYMDDVKHMLKEYRRRKEFDADAPSMDISDITIEEVYERAGLACIAEKNLSAEVSEAMKQPFRLTK